MSDLIGSLGRNLGSAATQATKDVRQFTAEMDPENPQDLFKMQMKMTKMQITNQLEMQIMNSINEMLKSMVQRM